MFNITSHSKFIHILLQDIKDLNKYVLGILKKMAKSYDIRQTEAWTQSKMQMISILTKKIQRINVDQHFKNVDVNDFHMGIHSLVSCFSLSTFQKNIFPDKYNVLCHLLLEWQKQKVQSSFNQLVWPSPSGHLVTGIGFLFLNSNKKCIWRNGCGRIHL